MWFSWLLRLPKQLSAKEPACQCKRRRRHRFHPWVRKIPWRRKWQPSPVFLPAKSSGQRSLVDYSPYKKLDMTEHTCMIQSVYLLWWNLLKFHPPAIHWVILFLLLLVFFIYSRLFIGHMFCKYFSQSVTFHIWVVFFEEKKFKFWWSPFLSYSSYFFVFYFRNLCLSLNYQDFPFSMLVELL